MIPSAVETPHARIDVYQLRTSGPGYKFFAVAHPPGERPVIAYDDDEVRVERRVRDLMNL